MMDTDHPLMIPDWPAPAHVRAVCTTRRGGVSRGPYASLNLGDHVGDDPDAVAINRRRLQEWLPDLPGAPVWLRQVHGIRCVPAVAASMPIEADAAVGHRGQVCVVLTADCLPVLLCDRAGTVVAAVHAGWRGLCEGVIEETIRHMRAAPGALLAWMGPAIGPEAFEVGDEVRQAFLAKDPEAGPAFQPGLPGKWWADLYLLARRRLQRMGVREIYGGGDCTYGDPERFFSYRRDGETGRMAALIWIPHV